MRPLPAILQDVRTAGEKYGEAFEKVFVADGDALSMGTKDWLAAGAPPRAGSVLTPRQPGPGCVVATCFYSEECSG